MGKKILTGLITLLMVILPLNVFAEDTSSPILRSPSSPESHGNIVDIIQLNDSDLKINIYEDGHGQVVSTGSRDVYDHSVLGSTFSVAEQVNKAKKIKSLAFDDGIKFKLTGNYAETRKLLHYFTNVTDIDLSNVTVLNRYDLDTPKDTTGNEFLENLNSLFESMGYLKHVTFNENWKKQKFSDCASFFGGCGRLERIDGLENLDMTPVNAGSMFYATNHLKYADLSTLNLTKVTSIGNIFRYSALDFGDLFSRQIVMPISAGEFLKGYLGNNRPDITGVKIRPNAWVSMNSVFQWGGGIEPIYDWSDINSAKSVNFSGLYQYSTMTPDWEHLPKQNSSKVNYNQAFSHMKMLKYVDLSYFDTTKEKNQRNLSGAQSVFYNDPNIESIKTSSETLLEKDKEFGLQHDKLFEETNLYTGRWVLKYDESGLPINNGKIATSLQDFNGVDGYWIRETKVEFNTLPSGGRIYETKDGKWNTNPDGSMTYEINVLDKNATHYIVEEENHNYERIDTDLTRNGIKYSTSNNGTAVVKNKVKGAKEPEFRELVITKRVNSVDDTVFTFKIKLTGDSIKGIQEFSDVLFNNGEAIIGINGNKSKTIKLPKDVSYEITEMDNPKWELVSSQNTTGTLDVKKNVVFTNKYKQIKPNNHVTKIIIEKEYQDGYNGELKDKQWDITVSLSNLTPNLEYSYIDATGVENTFISNSAGTATINCKINPSRQTVITLKGTDSAKFKVTEEITQQNKWTNITPSYQVYSNDKLQDNVGGEVNQSLNSKVYTATYKDVTRMVIHNQIDTFYALSVSKNTIGDENQTFKFTINLRGMKKTDVIKSDLGDITYNGDVTSIETELRHNQNIELFNIPSYVEYEVVEQKNNLGYISNYSVGTENSNNTEVNAELSTGYKSGNGQVNVKFTNVTTNNISITKEVTGNGGNKAEEFTFKGKITKEDNTVYKKELYYVNGDNEYHVTPDENGEFTFKLKHGETVSFQGLDLGGKYHLKIEELDDKYITTNEVVGDISSKKSSKTFEYTGKSSNLSIKYVNSSDVQTPTGIMLPFGSLLLLIGVGIIIVIKRRKREE